MYCNHRRFTPSAITRQSCAFVTCCCRGVAAAFASWLEDRGGIKLFSLDEDFEVEMARAMSSLSDLPFHGGLPRAPSGTPAANVAAPPALPPPAHRDAGLGPKDTPEFFQSTKFFACLDVEEAKQLFQASTKACENTLCIHCGHPFRVASHVACFLCYACAINE